MVVERITGKQDHICMDILGCRQYLWQDRQSIFVAETVVRTKMKIRAVNDGYFWV